MQNIFLSIILGSELSFYLLIIQTGIVEYFKSNLFDFWTLPIGGIIGTLISYKNFYFINSINKKLSFALFFQLLLSIFYPNFNLITLFLLGFSVGVLAPILTVIFVNKNIIYPLLGLALAYTIGTILFNFDKNQRDLLAISFSAVAFIASLNLNSLKERKNHTFNYISILPLFLWLLLDSSLFEILSRSENISIWRGEHTILIIIFHLIGLLSAYFYRNREFNYTIITLLFSFSYLFYYINEGFLLSIVYPFVISYYNFFMFDKLIKIGNLKSLGVIMFFTCWSASGIGLMLSLYNLIYIPILFLLVLIILTFNFIKKEKYA